MKKKKNIEIELEIEEKDANNPNLERYDYIYPLNHLVSLDEQKIKVEELTQITNISKNHNEQTKKK